MEPHSTYDLKLRCLSFAQTVNKFAQLLPKSPANIEYTKQLLRSSASIGANYLEAQGAMSTKDFLHKVKIARKEADETRYWLNLVSAREEQIKQQLQLVNECSELIKILSAICIKIERKIHSP